MAAVYGLTVSLATSPAFAQGIPLIRDTEVENLLKDYSRPIFKAAGLGSHISMRIVRHERAYASVGSFGKG
jgi:predicted Zn-dependent protease